MPLVYLVTPSVQENLNDRDSQVVQGVQLLGSPLVPVVHVVLLVQQDQLVPENPGIQHVLELRYLLFVPADLLALKQ